MFKKKIDLNEKEFMNLSKKTKQIEDSYKEEIEEEDLDEEVVEENTADKKYKRMKRISNIIFILILIIMAMITTDIVRVAKYDKKPIFVIHTKTYKDGGSKEYMGIGYKVIDYKQLQGRRDIEIGTWGLKYNVNPITIQDIDLAINLYNDEETTYKNYYKKFVRIISTLEKVDNKNHKITIGYTDEDGKYSLDIECDIVKEQYDIDKLEEGKSITIIGTIDDYKVKTSKKNRRIHISNCIAEQ